MTAHPNRNPPAENRSAFLGAVLARALPEATPGAISRAVSAMQHAAAAHKRWGENCCNYPMTPLRQSRGDKRCDRLAQAAYDAVLLCGDGVAPWTGAFGAQHMPTGRVLRLSFGGDPRGPCGWLLVDDMPGDGFGPGFAIYGRG